ncbi:hypothetical protein [Litoribacter populi]|uniref:hypothetical protein n=1 Tax=Litoribacter populi TaxID=2598460 RepID=UPI00117C727D|nr:hypothetical protein [Litoribacter populi]
MAKHNTRADKLKVIFATYPKQDEVFMTSDDRAFFTAHQADSHGQTLKDQKVGHYTRRLVEAFVKAKETEETETGDAVKGATLTINADETPKDETPKDEAPADEAPKDEAPAGETPADETPKDEESPKEESKEVDEREALSARFQELTGKKPAHNIKLENLKAAIEAAEKENQSNQ